MIPGHQGMRFMLLPANAGVWNTGVKKKNVVVIIYETLYISLSERDPLNVSSFTARVISV